MIPPHGGKGLGFGSRRATVRPCYGIALVVLAWPQAQLGVMGAKQAVDLVHRRAIEAADDPGEARGEFAGEYERDWLSSEIAAREGAVDEIVAPTSTRRRLCDALGCSRQRPPTSSAR